MASVVAFVLLFGGFAALVGASLALDADSNTGPSSFTTSATHCRQGRGCSPD